MADYATLVELKAEINLLAAADDATLARLLTSASRAIDRHCNRLDGFIALEDAEARYYPGTGFSWLRIDECTEITLVEVKDSPSDTTYTAWTSPTTDYAGDGDWLPAKGGPQHPVFSRTPYTLLICDPNGLYVAFPSGRYSMSRASTPRQTAVRVPAAKITAKWGYATIVPDQIKTACIMQSARWYKRLQSAMADTLASGELGQLLYTKKIDPDVAFILQEGRFVRPAIGI